MTTHETFVALAVALGSAFLIGLQREQSAAAKAAPAGPALGGIRTFPLVALVGAVCTLLAAKFGVWILLAGFAALLIPFGIAYADDVRNGRDRGITSEVAFILTYFLGAFAVADGAWGVFKDRLLLVASAGVAATALLSLKRPLHELAVHVSSDDLYATVKFGVLAVIILPLLPDRPMGPLEVFNPFHIGLMVALIAGTSFVGYVAIRLLGPGRGLGITGLLGGLVSSTAITLSFSGRARKEPAVVAACAMGVVLASTIMALRVLAEVAVVNPGLVSELALPMGAMAAGGAAGGLALYLRSGAGVKESEGVRLHNPFELTTSFKFGLFFAAVLFVSKAATTYAGAKGIYLTGFLAGSTDVDAVTLSMAKLAREGLASREAVTAILLAAASNTMVKAAMACLLGGAEFAKRVLGAFALMLLCGAAGAAWLWMR
jgi:uncharacterized membrane protein (DUF4010 family)